MAKAELVLIRFDHNTFLTALITKATSIGEEKSQDIHFDEPLPIIKGVQSGHHSLVFGFADENENLRFALFNEEGHLVKEKKVPTVPMFSGFADSVYMMEAEEPIDFSEDEDFEKSAKKFFESGQDSIQKANEALQLQLNQFVEEMSDWFEFNPENKNLLGHVFSVIVENAIPFILLRRDRQFSGNSGPAAPRRN